MARREEHRDRVAAGDGLEISLRTDEELVSGAGVEELEAGEPTRPKPDEVALELRAVERKGVGVFVSTQKAPLTLANATWFDDDVAARAAADAFVEQFGWAWTPARYEWSETEETVDGPYGPETKTVHVRGELLEEGYWSHSYGLVFDPASLGELGLSGGKR